MILVGPNLTTLPTIATGAVQMVATSPPYFGLRRYGDSAAEMGAEPSLDAYVAGLVAVMRECKRVLRDDGCAWVNLGDSYGAGGGALLVPFRVAAALQAEGWTLRAMLPWVKIASMPESVQSRPSMAHEYVLFLTKRPSGYFYDADAVRVAMSRGSAGSLFTTGKTGVNGAGRVSQLPREDNPAGRSYRSSDTWRAGAREAAAQLLAAADGTAIGMLTNDDAPAALVVNPKGSGIQHFAMWPTRLVAPMIMAGTPEAGSCSVCGAPCARVVEARTVPHATRHGSGPIRRMAFSDAGQGHENLERSNLGMSRDVQTLGFRPSCEHADVPARPAIVLDPFVGVGTTIGIAEALGREAIGCELYQANADLLPARTAIVRGEMVEYLQGRGEKIAHVAESGSSLGPLFGGAL